MPQVERLFDRPELRDATDFDVTLVGSTEAFGVNAFVHGISQLFSSTDKPRDWAPIAAEVQSGVAAGRLLGLAAGVVLGSSLGAWIGGPIGGLATFWSALRRQQAAAPVDMASVIDVVKRVRGLGFETMSRAQIFRFLAAVVDPLAQSPEGQTQLVAAINDHLRQDGYRLTEVGRISGSPRYEVRSSVLGAPSDDGISATLAAFSPDDVHARWTAALDRRASDPSGAITLARTLLEDVCKWVLAEANDTSVQEKDDLPALYKKLAKVLKLAPDDHTEQVFKEILGNCQHVVVSLGALRNKLGDAHSPGPKRARPLARHAELAVNLSGTMATFLVSTWRARQPEQSRGGGT